MKLQRQAAFWIGLYIIMVLAPIALVLVPPLPPARGFWIEFGVGLGFVGLAMMGVQFALTARFRWIAREIGMDSMLHFHRQAGLVAFGFVMAHPVILILANRDFLAFFDPRVNFLRTVALSGAIVLLILIIALTLYRQAMRIPYEWWRLTHGLMAMLVLLIGLAHTLMVGHYVSVFWKQALWVVLIGGAIGLLAQMRVLKPMLAWRKPWRVESVRKEVEKVWTITLAPTGHHGLHFDAGQCVWLTIESQPFTLDQHPFTIASSAERPDRLEFTIKELGDYTATVGDVKPGAVAYMEGPYGAFTLPAPPRGRPGPGEPMVMIAGGIGITPFMSMLRTMVDREDKRQALLLYGTPTLEATAFRDELAELERELNLKVMLVLEKPPEGWEGETGYITPVMIERCAAEYAGDETLYYVCGPDIMMDTIESALLERGVPLSRINSERFNIA